jgi:hypothetical protein
MTRMDRTLRSSEPVRVNGYKFPAYKGPNMPMRGELSVPRVKRRSGRPDNQEFWLIAAFCILGLTLSVFIAIASRTAEPENIMLAVKAFG